MRATKTFTLPALGVVLLTALAACTVGPDYQRPPITTPDALRGADPAAPTPAADTSAAEAAPPTPSLADRAWWELLDDETLERLIDEALTANHDLRLAAQRVDEARALAGIARSERLPRAEAGAGWSRGRDPELIAGSGETRDLYEARLGLSWELDLWGRLRRLDEAALARYLATEEAARGVRLSLVSEVAAAYFRLRALDRQLAIARRTADAFQATHAVFADRLEAGLASSLETSSAAASVAATSAVVPDLERRIAAQENLLSFLLGREPGSIERGAALDDQLLPPTIPAGLPADLLERRPDLRRAEQELRAASAGVGVAVADYFPRISLTGAFGGVATEVSELFGDGETWSVGAGLLSPILQGSRLRDRHRAAGARWEQAKTRYEQSVVNAFAEVSSALVDYRKLAEVEREQALAVDAYREAVDAANTRYLSGLADYLEVLQAQQQLFPTETALAQTRFERLATLVDLYRALGGGWSLADGEWTGRSAEAGGVPPLTAPGTGAILAPASGAARTTVTEPGNLGRTPKVPDPA